LTKSAVFAIREGTHAIKIDFKPFKEIGCHFIQETWKGPLNQLVCMVSEYYYYCCLTVVKPGSADCPLGLQH